MPDLANIFYSYLRSLEPHMIPLNPLPVTVTEAKKLLVENARPKHKTFFDYVFVQGSYPILDTIIKIDENEACISTEDIFATYQLWCKSYNSACTHKFMGFIRLISECSELNPGPFKNFGNGRKRHYIINRACYENVHVYHNNTAIPLASFLNLTRKQPQLL